MLFRALRSTTSYLPLKRVPIAVRLMSTPTNPPKRALSPSAPALSTSTSINSTTTSPDSKRVKLTTDVKEDAPKTELTAKQNRKIAGRSNNNNNSNGGSKGRKSKVKAPKPGGVEEAGAFDVVELLGAERVAELERMEKEDGKDWRKAAEEEWGNGPNGKDIEIKIVGINSHGEPLEFNE